MVVKKYKRNKANGMSQGRPGPSGQQSHTIVPIKEPIFYLEEVVITYVETNKEDIAIYELKPIDNIVPFGYPTILFLKSLKDSILSKLQSYKDNN